ncbi:DEAD/DEAH box helicase [Marinobacter nauticus]|uniref:ERCC4-related helicase n=1 Tax=Marinobacter nauticus TaxID=2743 RepID=A0A368URG4_MARNT|nr:DEAD/DEAH box helicase [Marinobacter nauticus]RBP68626.1 ERCC4-related helicase [Marinobacter nauticus]RCW29984.1 ERCC4-related helicase [Marinobacter nauticus]
MTVFTPGMRVECRDAEWLVTRVDAAGSNQHQIVFCTGVDDLNRGHEAAFLTQLDRLKEVDPRKTELVRDETRGYSTARLFLEAQLRQMPLTDPEPHFEDMGAFTPMDYQKEAVYRALQQMRPRLLLADQVGLGKTIEVGMILSELIRRGQGQRILVLAKKSMLTQFQAELWNRFALPLVRMDSDTLSKLQLKIPASKNPFEVYHRIIISIDTLKDIGRYAHFLENTRWDVVVIDEAHNVSGGTNPERHLSYRLARRLSRRTNSMILTTATPHNGKRETFGRLISLLDPSAVPDPKLQEYEAEDIAPFFLMRFKEDVKEEAGSNFSEREVIPLPQTTVQASEAEEDVYQQLAHIRQLVLDKQIDAQAIVSWGMYKSFLSSPEACRSTAEKRLAYLQKSDPDSREIEELEELLRRLEYLNVQQSARFKLLVEQLAAMGWDGSSKSPRLLVFTESRVTQEYLAPALAKHFGQSFSPKQEKQPEQTIAAIHGGMSDNALAAAVEAFGTGNSPVRLMLATDVASEGVNLHHQCHNIIHYDLPWSIITLIQRNGRIDRFGQKYPPIIRYLMVETESGLLEGDSELFSRLVSKVEEINRSTRTGESVLKLYDARKEEETFGDSLVKGDTGLLDRETGEAETGDLESTLKAANELAHQDYADFLSRMLGGGEPDEDEVEEAAANTDNSRIRLLDNGQFFEQGYRVLKEQIGGPDWHPLEQTGQQIIFTPPKELAKRLGAPWLDSEMVYGASAMPEEAWPDDQQLFFTDKPERVDLAIKAALAQKGQWSKELLLTEQHPVMQWLAEKLMMLQKRGEAPLIASPFLEPGELLFCFIGQVSSRAGTPLIVDPHAVSFRKGGQFQIRPLKEALDEVNFEQLANTGKTGTLPDHLLKSFLGSAVDQSVTHLKKLKDQRRAQIRPRLDEENARLKHWFERWAERIDAQLANLPPEGRRATQLRQKREEMEKYLEDRRENWEQTHYRATDEATTRLVLVVEGVK